MSQIENSKVHDQIDAKYDECGIEKIAGELDSQEDAIDVGHAVRDAGETKRARPVIWPLRETVRRFWMVAWACFAIAFGVVAIGLVWPSRMVGGTLLAALVTICLAIAMGMWATARARAILREDSRIPAVIDLQQIRETAVFVRTFGHADSFDGSGALLALAGGADGVLAGYLIGNGLAQQVPVLALFVLAAFVAMGFVKLLAMLTQKFTSACVAIRAKNWVRRLAAIDVERFPAAAAELAYAREKFRPPTDDDFAKPTAMHYLKAAVLLLMIPAVFALLILVRVLVANRDGAADVVLVASVSAICAVFATLAAVLHARGHVLRDEALWRSMLARRFPDEASFEHWEIMYARECRRWGNEVARRINAARARMENDGDHRAARRKVVVPRPFPPIVVSDDLPTGQVSPANDPEASGKERA